MSALAFGTFNNSFKVTNNASDNSNNSNEPNTKSWNNPRIWGEAEERAACAQGDANVTDSV